MKPGDKVRYLNATGGGTVTRIEGQLAYVEEDGFETPVLIKELVVVLPAGHTSSSGAQLMFDQEAYNAGKLPHESATPKQAPAPQPSFMPASSAKGATPVTDGKFCLSLVFEPTDIKNLSKSRFNMLLVNDSNYAVAFAVAKRRTDSRLWTTVYRDLLPAEEIIDLTDICHEDLPDFENIAVQAIAFADGEFALCPPLNVARRIDITKFHKLHCFHPSDSFDTPVLEFKLAGDKAPDYAPLINSLDSKKGMPKPKPGDLRHPKAKEKQPSPNVAGDTVVVDLHMHELTDSMAGLKPADMLDMQLREVRRTMEANRRRIGQRIVFIHGKGEGVLRNAVIKLLKKEYPKAEIQDASFREYGFGASQVTIH